MVFNMAVIKSISELNSIERKNTIRKNHKFMFDFNPIHNRGNKRLTDFTEFENIGFDND